MKKFLLSLLSDNDRVESAIAFCTGDIAAMIITYHVCWVKLDFSNDLFVPVVLAILTGFFGGAFAILGKIFIKWLFKIK